MSGIPLERTHSIVTSLSVANSFVTSINHNNPSDDGPHAHSFPPTHQLFSYGTTTTSSSSSSSHAVDSSQSNNLSNLSPLLDETSSPYAVSKACLYISQFCASPTTEACDADPLFTNSSVQDGTNEYTHASLYHIPTLTRQISVYIQALRTCASTHSQRKCRILALRCLAILARSMFAKLRFSSAVKGVLLMDEGNMNSHNHMEDANDSNAHVTISRVEDECTNDAAITLAEAALMEEDECVSAAAMEGLAILVGYSHTHSKDAGLADVLHQEIRRILYEGGGSQNHSDNNMGNEEEDAMLDLQIRVMENVIPPRIRRMVHRFSLFADTNNVMKALPFFSSAFTYLLTASSLPQINQTIPLSKFAKRWYEKDITTLVAEFIQKIILPGMVDSFNEGFQLSCAICAIRLVDACAKNSRGSISEVNGAQLCQFAADILLEHSFANTTDEISLEQSTTENEMLERKCAMLAMTIMTTRVIPLSERPDVLLGVLEGICSLPVFSNAPQGILCPSGITLTTASGTCMNRPIRIGLLIEFAVNLFTDGVASTLFPEERSETLKYILSEQQVASILHHRLQLYRKPNVDTASGQQSAFFPENEVEEGSQFYNGPHIAEELVFAFCSTAISIGSQLNTSPREQGRQSLSDMEEWLQCSIVLLDLFSSCIHWSFPLPTTSERGDLGATSSSLEESEQSHQSQTLSAVESYLSLFGLCLSKLGLISINLLSSLSHIIPSIITLSNSSPKKFTPVTKPSTLSNDSNTSSSFFAQHCPWATRDLSILCDRFLTYRLREGVPSLSIRVSLLSLLANYWTKQNNKLSSSSDHSPTTPGAREIVSMFGNEISTLIEKSSTHSFHPHDLELLLLCVQSVERMALSTFQKGGESNDVDSTSTDSNQDSSYIASVSLVALTGHAKSPPMKSDKGNEIHKSPQSKHFFPAVDNPPSARMVEECQLAAKRIRSAMDGAFTLTSVPTWEAQSVAGDMYQTPPRPLNPNNYGTTPSSYVSNKSGSHMFSPAILSPLHSLVPLLPVPNNTFVEGLFWQQARLMSLSRITWALKESPLGTMNIPTNQSGGGTTTGMAHPNLGGSNVPFEQSRLISRPVIPRNPLRLPSHSPESKVQFMPESMGDIVQTISGASDPLCITMAYGVRNVGRFDGEKESHVLVTIRTTNITPVPVSQGLKMELSILRHFFDNRLDLNDDNNDDIDNGDVNSSMLTKNILSSLNITRIDEVLSTQYTTTSTSAMFKAELAPYESLTWEVILHQWPAGHLELSLAVTFRDIAAELPTHRWLSNETKDTTWLDPQDSKVALDSMEKEKGAREEEEEEDGDDVFDVDDKSVGAQSKNTVETGPLDEEYLEDDVLDLVFTCDSVFIDVAVMLQPCPLVFFAGIPPTTVLPNPTSTTTTTTWTTKNESSNHGAFPTILPRKQVTTPNPSKVSTGSRMGSDERAFWFLWWNMPRKVVQLSLSRCPTLSTQQQQQQQSQSQSQSQLQKEELNEYKIGIEKPLPSWRAIMKDSMLFVAQDHHHHFTTSEHSKEKRRIRAWAFMTWCGNRLLCLESEGHNDDGNHDDNNNNNNNNHHHHHHTTSLDNHKRREQQRTLEIRCDNVMVLLSLIGSPSSRRRFVQYLIGMEWECEESLPQQEIQDNFDNHHDNNNHHHDHNHNNDGRGVMQVDEYNDEYDDDEYDDDEYDDDDSKDDNEYLLKDDKFENGNYDEVNENDMSRDGGYNASHFQHSDQLFAC